MKVSRASLKYLYSTCMTKHPSRKVMNFTHSLSCDTIEIDDENVSVGLFPA